MTVLPSEEVMMWLNKHTWNPNFEILKICPEVSLDVTQTNVEMLSQTAVTPLTPPPPSSPPPCYGVVINMYCEHDMTFPVACYCEWIGGLQKRLRKKKQKSRKHLRDRECTKLTSDDCMSALKWFHCDPLIHSHLSQGKYEEKKSLISWCQLLSDCQLSRALSPCSLSGRMTRACRTRFVLGNMSRNMT